MIDTNAIASGYGGYSAPTAQPKATSTAGLSPTQPKSSSDWNSPNNPIYAQQNIPGIIGGINDMVRALFRGGLDAYNNNKGIFSVQPDVGSATGYDPTADNLADNQPPPLTPPQMPQVTPAWPRHEMPYQNVPMQNNPYWGSQSPDMTPDVYGNLFNTPQAGRW